MSTTMNGHTLTSARPPRDLLPAAVGLALAGLERSAQPAVVFSSLVRLCVPSICEAARATVSGPDGEVCAVSWPREPATLEESRVGQVVVHFDAPATEDHEAFHGDVTLGFSAPDSADPFVAQLVVDRAMATVERERLLESLGRIQRSAENLEVALASNREIGVAIGIVMATHSVTAGQAFDALREVSQRSNVKLRAIALDVTRTGALPLPPQPEAESGADRA